MKIFSNQGQHLNTGNQPKKAAPTKKLISSQSTKKQPPAMKAIPSKEDFRKLFETNEPMVSVTEEQTAPVIEEQTAPVIEEQTAPVIEEQTAPVIKEQTTPVIEEQTTPVIEEQTAPVIEEQSAPVIEEQTAPAIEEQSVSSEATIAIDSIDADALFNKAESPIQAHTPAPAVKNADKFNYKNLQTIGIVAVTVALVCVLFGISAFFINTLKDTLALQNEILNNDTPSVTVTQTPAPDSETTPQPVESTAEPTPTPEPTPEPSPVILEKYAKDASKNPDMFGWIQIEDTKIDYPVMHTPDDPEKYLHKSFNGFPSASGTLFIDAKCSHDSDNLIIYGHNIKNGTMFNSIIKYENIDYFNAHPVIQFDTLYEEQEYEVMSAFYDRVYYKSETDVFKFYQFIDATDEDHFNSAVQTLKDKSIYDTGVDAAYGDQLIMLVTCAYHTENGRFVVVARKAA